MTMKRNGLSGSVARGMNRLSASACSSPWLITPSAAPATPSTVTSSATRRRLPSPVSWMRPSSTWLCWRRRSQMPAARSAIGPEAVVADARGRLLQPGFGLLDRARGARPARPRPARPPASWRSRGHGPPCVFLLLRARARAASRRRRTASRSGTLADSTCVGERLEIGDVPRPDPDAQRLHQLREVQPHLGRALQRVALQDARGPPSACAPLPRARAPRPPPCADARRRSSAVCCLRAPGACRALPRGRRPDNRRPRARRGRRGRARAASPRRATARRRCSVAEATARRGRAHLGGGLGHARRVGRLQARDLQQHLRRARLRRRARPRPPSADSTAARSHSLPEIAAATRRARSSSTPSQPLDQAAARLGRFLLRLLAREARLLQRCLCLAPAPPAPGSRTARRRASTGPRRAASPARCRRGTAGACAARRSSPARPCPRRPARRARRTTSATSNAASVLPASARPRTAGARPRPGRWPRAPRRGMMEVPPAVAPDGRAVLPAEAVAGQQRLDGFREAGLAGAVAPDDQREARARRAAPALARVRRRGSPRPGSSAGTRRRRAPVRRRRLVARRGGASGELGLEAVAPAERRQQHRAPRLGGAIGLDPRGDDPTQAGIHPD